MVDPLRACTDNEVAAALMAQSLRGDRIVTTTLTARWETCARAGHHRCLNDPG